MTRRGVAAFDFDGTITRRDTLVPFVRRVGGLASLLRAAPRAAALVAERDVDRRRHRGKEALFRAGLRGRPHDDLEGEGRSYAAGLADGYRPEQLERIAWHADQGHELVLVTASLRVYAEPAAEALGFHHVIAVDLAVDDDGRATGSIVGPNVRGPEKAVRLRAHLGDDEVELWAYGNSSGDRELLAMADHPSWVGRRGA